MSNGTVNVTDEEPLWCKMYGVIADLDVNVCKSESRGSEKHDRLKCYFVDLK